MGTWAPAWLSTLGAVPSALRLGRGQLVTNSGLLLASAFDGGTHLLDVSTSPLSSCSEPTLSSNLKHLVDWHLLTGRESP